MAIRYGIGLPACLLPLLFMAGVACGGPGPDGGDAGGAVPGAGDPPRLLAWQDYGSGWPPPGDDRGRGGHRDDRGYDHGDRHGQQRRPPEPQRQGPLPPQAYPGGRRPTCAPGTHLEGWDCVRDPSGPAIIDQPRHGCPRDYHTNRKGTKCIRDGYEE